MGMNLPAPRTTILGICMARERTLTKMQEGADTLAEAYALTKEATLIAQSATQGYRAQDPHNTKPKEGLFSGEYQAETALLAYRKSLDADIWTHLFETTGMADMMDATAKKIFTDGLLTDPPEATEENITATLQRLFANADMIFQRGLAVTFSKLDKRFKSHDGFKIGSRMIMDYMFDQWGSPTYGQRWDNFSDVERVFAVLDGEKPSFSTLRDAIRQSRKWGDAQQSETEGAYFRVKGFKNGNAHLWFTRDDLVEKANKLLAAFYGETLPDAATVNEKPIGTAVAKDLQFYGTPPDAVRSLLNGLNFSAGSKILEPSAGEGAIVRALPRHVEVTAVEFHPVRASYTGAIQANFLTWNGPKNFNYVLMNPPFYGTHWMDHVRKAFDHLAPRGTLRAILPASAEVNETAKHLEFRAWVKKNSRDNYHRPWHDLPPGSFVASGTNIQTVILEMHKP